MQCLALEEPELTFVAVEPGVVRTAMLEQVRQQSTKVFPKEQAARMEGFWRTAQSDASGPAEAMSKIAFAKLDEPLSGKVLLWNDQKVAKLQWSL